MTEIYSPISQCYGKVAYSTGREAKIAIKQVESRWGRRLNKYHCPHCGWYHIGNRVVPHEDEIEECDADELVSA